MNLRKQRKKLGLTLEQIAAQLGCSDMFLSRVERGLCGVPVKKISAFAKAYALTESQIVNTLVRTFKNKILKEMK